METIIYPYQSENFFEIWNIWKQYKREQFRFTFKGVISEQAQLKRLAELSEGNEAMAIEIINYAIAQNWRGFYPIPASAIQKPKTIFESLINNL